MKERLISGREFWLGAAQIYAFVVVGVAFVLLSRWMGPTKFGTFGTLYSAAVLVGTVLHFSVGQVGLARAGQASHAPWLAATVRASERLSVVGVLGGMASALILWWVGIIDQPGAAAAILAFLVPLSMWDYFSIQLLSAAGLVGRLNLILVIGRTVLSAAALAGGQVGPHAALAGVAVGLTASCVLTAFALRKVRSGSPQDGQAVGLADPLRAGLLLHAAALGSILIARGPVLVLARQLGEFEAGQYLLAFQLLSAFLVIPTAASLGVAARISSQGPDGAWAWQLRITALVAGSMGALGVAAWFAERPLLFLLGDSNELAVHLFRLLLPALVGWPVAILMGPQWVARGLLWQAALLTLLLAGICLGLTVALVPMVGADAASWGTSITFLVALATNIGLGLYARRPRLTTAGSPAQ